MSETVLHSIETIFAKRRDFSLVKSVLSGDGKAFSNLVSIYKKRIFALGLGFFKRKDDAEDFVQEVFMKVYTKLSSFRFESSFSTWITSIAYNLAINSVGRKKDWEPLPDEEILRGSALSPEEELVRKLTVEAVREAVRELPDNYGICLEFYFFHDLSYEEIARVTGFPLNTIKSHIFRGKQILRKKLNGVLK